MITPVNVESSFMMWKSSIRSSFVSCVRESSLLISLHFMAVSTMMGANSFLFFCLNVTAMIDQLFWSTLSKTTIMPLLGCRFVNLVTHIAHVVFLAHALTICLCTFCFMGLKAFFISEETIAVITRDPFVIDTLETIFSLTKPKTAIATMRWLLMQYDSSYSNRIYLRNMSFL